MAGPWFVGWCCADEGNLYLGQGRSCPEMRFLGSVLVKIEASEGPDNLQVSNSVTPDNFSPGLKGRKNISSWRNECEEQ